MQAHRQQGQEGRLPQRGAHHDVERRSAVCLTGVGGLRRARAGRRGHDAAGEAFNIAYGGREYLLDIYYGLTEALGLKVEPNFGPDRPGDIKHSNADISKAKELLGYNPEWSFERGIQAAIEWYRENL